MYVKISKDEKELINNLCLFNENMWIEVEYNDDKYKLLLGLTIGFAVAFGLSVLVIIWLKTKKLRSDEDDDEDENEKNVEA